MLWYYERQLGLRPFNPLSSSAMLRMSCPQVAAVPDRHKISLFPIDMRPFLFLVRCAYNALDYTLQKKLPLAIFEYYWTLILKRRITKLRAWRFGSQSELVEVIDQVPYSQCLLSEYIEGFGIVRGKVPEFPPVPKLDEQNCVTHAYHLTQVSSRTIIDQYQLDLDYHHQPEGCNSYVLGRRVYDVTQADDVHPHFLTESADFIDIEGELIHYRALKTVGQLLNGSTSFWKRERFPQGIERQLVLHEFPTLPIWEVEPYSSVHGYIHHPQPSTKDWMIYSVSLEDRCNACTVNTNHRIIERCFNFIPGKISSPRR